MAVHVARRSLTNPTPVLQPTSQGHLTSHISPPPFRDGLSPGRRDRVLSRRPTCICPSVDGSAAHSHLANTKQWIYRVCSLTLSGKWTHLFFSLTPPPLLRHWISELAAEVVLTTAGAANAHYVAYGADWSHPQMCTSHPSNPVVSDFAWVANATELPGTEPCAFPADPAGHLNCTVYTKTTVCTPFARKPPLPQCMFGTPHTCLVLRPATSGLSLAVQPTKLSMLCRPAPPTERCKQRKSHRQYIT